MKNSGFLYLKSFYPYCLAAVMLLPVYTIFGQNSSGVNTMSPSSKAALDIETSSGFKQGLLVPRLAVSDTTTLKSGIPFHSKGLVFFDTTAAVYRYWSGTKWLSFGGTGSVGSLSGTGTINYVPKWIAGSSLTNSLIYDDGTRIGVNEDFTVGNIDQSMFTVRNNTTNFNYGYTQRNGGTPANEVIMSTYIGNSYTPTSIPGASIGTQTDHPFFIYIGNNGEKFYIGNSAQNYNVGIGTSTPLAKLSIVAGLANWDLASTEGDFRIGDDTYRLKMGIATGGGGAGDAYIGAQGGTNRVFIGGGTTVAQMQTLSVSPNRVGINVPAPLGMLHVSGADWGGTPGPPVIIESNGSTGPTLRFQTASRIYDIIGSTLSGSSPGVGSFGIWDNTSSAYRFVISPTGNVGIGTYTPTATLCVAGNIAYTSYLGACSDIRYKKNIITLNSVLNAVMNMTGVYYHWKTEEFPDRKFDKERQIGLIAQEVEKVYPELVITDENGYKSVDYPKLSPILLQAIKEQQVIIKNQDKKLKEIENQLEKQKLENNLNKAAIEEIRRQIGTGLEVKK